MGAGIAILAALSIQSSGIREIRDQAYYKGPDEDEAKHKLDLYLPQDGRKFPTAVFIHGGAWREGDRRLYVQLGRRFARDGIGFAAISYRLSPAVKHPEHARDSARAFAWVQANIARHGGDPARLFLMGHSAGGHLTALLAADPRHLREAGAPDGALKGAIPMSGVYLIPALPEETRGLLRFIPQAFGSDPEACRDASPVNHLRTLSCPMLVVTETRDTLLVRPSMEILRAAVRRQGIAGVEFFDAQDRDHITIIARTSAPGDDPVRAKIIEWIRRRCAELDAGRQPEGSNRTPRGE